MKDLFTEQDRDRIREAVSEAEQQTSGEIVPLIVRQSESYEVAAWKGAAIGAIAAMTLAILIYNFYDGWGLGWLHTGWGSAFLTLVVGSLGAAVGAFVPPAKRMLAGNAAMTRAVHRRAMKAFVEEEVFNTRDRTGILLFISLFEHRIEVLGDSGINEKVSVDEWVDVVETVRNGIKSGELAQGLVKAIGICGGLLERRGVSIRSDDTNELRNELRTREGH
jgi:putative membrane protein